MHFQPFGTRGSTIAPGVSFQEFGHHTICMLVTNANQDALIVDAGSGLSQLSQQTHPVSACKSNPSPNSDPNSYHILISHTHLDHLYGLLHFKPIFDPSVTLHIYGFKEVEDCLKHIMSDDPYTQLFPVPLHQLPCKVVFHTLTHLTPFTINTFTVTPYFGAARHHPNRGCIYYKIQADDTQLVTLWDMELPNHDPEIIAFAKHANALIHDTHFKDNDYFVTQKHVQGYGHSTHQMAIKTAMLAHATHLYGIHYHPDHTDIILKKLEKQLQEKSSIPFTFLREGVRYEVSK